MCHSVVTIYRLFEILLLRRKNVDQIWRNLSSYYRKKWREIIPHGPDIHTDICITIIPHGPDICITMIPHGPDIHTDICITMIPHGPDIHTHIYVSQ